MPISPTERLARIIDAAETVISLISRARGQIANFEAGVRERMATAGQRIEQKYPGFFSDEEMRNVVFQDYIKPLNDLVDEVEDALRLPTEAMVMLAEEKAFLRHREKLNANNRAYAQRNRTRKWLEQHPGEDYPYNRPGPRHSATGTDIADYGRFLVPKAERDPKVSDAWYEAKARQDAKEARSLCPPHVEPQSQQEALETSYAYDNEGFDITPDEPGVLDSPERHAQKVARAKRWAQEEAQVGRPRTVI